MSSPAKSRKRSRISSKNSGRKKSSAPTSETSSLPVSSNDQPGRDESGKFLPGTSGNPSGRPPNKRNQITEVKQDLELAIRQNMSPYKISQIVEKMCEMALEGSVGAAKLLLDKTLSNAKTETEDQEGPGTVKIVIENMTLGEKPKVNVIDVTPTPTEESQ